MTAADAHAHDDDDGNAVERSQVPAPPPQSPEAIVSECPVCGAAVQATELRCPRCNMTLAGIDGRPGPFSRIVLLVWAGALVLVYLVVLAIVAFFPA